MKLKNVFDVTGIKKGEIYKLSDNLDSNNGIYLVKEVNENVIELFKIKDLSLGLMRTLRITPKMSDRYELVKMKLVTEESGQVSVSPSVNKQEKPKPNKKSIPSLLDDFRKMLANLESKLEQKIMNDIHSGKDMDNVVKEVLKEIDTTIDKHMDSLNIAELDVVKTAMRMGMLSTNIAIPLLNEDLKEKLQGLNMGKDEVEKLLKEIRRMK